MRRFLDGLLAACGLLIAGPVMAFLALLIRLDSPGRPIFKQERVGRGGVAFQLYKLRSMTPKAGIASGLTQGLNDPRITRVGRWMRKTKLDELPQLWNVLRGDMSLVGPRPEVPEFVAHYNEQQRKVLAVRPGITDPASIDAMNEGAELAGVKDPDAHYLKVIMPRKVAAQIAYLEQRTLASDALVLLRTLVRLIVSR